MRPTKTSHSFDVSGNQVKFTSNFDSGNLRTVTQIGVDQFLIQSSLDSYETQVSFKSFFHFRIENYPLDTQIITNIQNLSLLSCIKSERRHRYRPCYSYNGHDYQRFDKDSIEIIENGNNLNLKIKFKITKQIVYFAFSIPYSYERYLNMVRDLPETSQQFYIKKQVLCYSKNLHLVYMITITSYDRQTKQVDQIGSVTNGVILPQRHLNQQRVYFDKPVILLSARVHPGESPSSWAIQGIIKFLIGNSNQAKLLRKHFLIVIVPMLNPDGVYQGMYRLDTLGHNLNRYYLISDNRQPSIYSMKHLIKHYHASKRLLFYFDFHGHPSFKGSFMYGNAIDQIAYQAETQLFGRIMSLKCKTFQEKYCIFDRQQMSSKDRFDMYTKEGCARVYAFRTANILHSYTIQMGFHACNNFNGTQNCDDFQYDQVSYYNEGIAVLLSVLEASQLMPKSSIHKGQLRNQIATEILIREQRFRKQDKNIGIKKKNVNETIQGQYWKPIRNKFFLPPSFTPHQKYRKYSRQSSRKYEAKSTTIVNSDLSQIRVSEKKQARKSQQCIKDEQQIKTMGSIQDSKGVEMFMLKSKKNIEAQQILFSIQNPRRLSLTSNKNSKNYKNKCILDHILPKSHDKPEKKRREIRIISEKQQNNQPYLSFRKQNTSEQKMFGDFGIRQEMPHRKTPKFRDTKNGFSYISANNFGGRLGDFHQVYKNEDQSHKQVSHRKAMKANKKYSKFFQIT